jgi:deoxyribonuclease-1
MRHPSLLICIVLTGCHAGQPPPPPVTLRSPPASISPAPTSTPLRLVNNQTAVGHRDFANAKKVLPKVFAGMENDFWCGCRYVGRVVELDSCGYQPRKNATRAGRVNGDRSNYAFSAWTRQPTSMYGACQTIVDFKLRRVQPRAEVRGRAARITLYMYQTYGLQLSRQDQQLMCAWSRTYGVDEWEKKRDQRIVRWQGTGNRLVSDPAWLKASCG